MEEKALLDLCLSVTAAFEGGDDMPYDTLTGNFDGMGLSVGCLQWNAGQGSLQTLLLNIGARMGWDKAQSFFKSDIHHLAVLRPTEAIQFCLDHYIAEGKTTVDPAAAKAWRAFLSQPESIDAQVELATNSVLHRALTLAKEFCPGYENRTRTISFFFDLVTQSGGMQNKRGKVDPVPAGTTPAYPEALAYAQPSHPKVAQWWAEACTDDPLAKLLVWYAYKRSLLSNAQFVWDAFSRRGAIACRRGIVHNLTVDFTNKLD